MALRHNLAANVRRIRHERGLSQDEFAAVVDLHRTYINHIEGAKRSPTIDVIEKMAERLGIVFTELLCEPPQKK